MGERQCSKLCGSDFSVDSLSLMLRVQLFDLIDLSLIDNNMYHFSQPKWCLEISRMVSYRLQDLHLAAAERRLQFYQNVCKLGQAT